MDEVQRTSTGSPKLPWSPCATSTLPGARDGARLCFGGMPVLGYVIGAAVDADAPGDRFVPARARSSRRRAGASRAGSPLMGHGLVRLAVILAACGRQDDGTGGRTSAGGPQRLLYFVMSIQHERRPAAGPCAYAGTDEPLWSNGKSTRRAQATRHGPPCKARKAPAAMNTTDGGSSTETQPEADNAAPSRRGLADRRACRHSKESTARANKAFEPQNEFKLDTWVHLGILSSTRRCSTCCSRP